MGKIKFPIDPTGQELNTFSYKTWYCHYKMLMVI